MRDDKENIEDLENLKRTDTIYTQLAHVRWAGCTILSVLHWIGL